MICVVSLTFCGILHLVLLDFTKFTDTLSMDHRLSVTESLQGMSNVTVFMCGIESLNKLCRFVLTVSFVLELVQLP